MLLYCKVFSCQFSPGDKYIATASADRTLRVWNTKQFKCEKKVDLDSQDGSEVLAYSSDGFRIITGGDIFGFKIYL